jgi:hypothetical protein
VGKYPNVKTLSKLVFPQAPSPIITNFLCRERSGQLVALVIGFGCTLSEEPQKRLAMNVNVEPLRTAGSTEYENN